MKVSINSRTLRALAPRRLGARIVAAALFAGAMVSACDVHEPATTAPSGALASIVVTPNVTLAINSSQQFVAVGKDAAGNVMAISPTWSVASGGGTVNTTGLFTAGTATGTFTSTVKASSGSIAGTASVTVTNGALASITITPTPDTLATGGTQQFSAVGKDVAGNIISIAPTWSVVASGGAISAAGMFTAGLVSGTFANTVKATSGNISGTGTVVVLGGALATIAVTPNPVSLPLNGTQQYTAVGKDANGNVAAIAPAVTWSVVAGGGAINLTGLFTAGAVAGTYTNTVKATSGALSGTATVTVTTSALASITVSPNPANVFPNGTQQYTAVGKDAGGNVVAVSPVWSVAAGGGVINSTGLFTAGAVVGTFTNTITATSGVISGTATVTVVGVLATITVTPNPMSLAINTTQQYTAVGKDAGGNVAPISPAVTWSVVAGGGAISGSGLFTAGAVLGTFTNSVKATSGAISGTATVTVTAGPLATIAVTPNPATMARSATQQFVAVGKDAGNNTVVISPAPTWAVDSGGGVINGTGLFTAGTLDSTFVATVRAQSGLIKGTATVIISPPSPLIPLGTAQFDGILGGTAVTCITAGFVGADVAVSPGSSASGFGGACSISGQYHLNDAVAGQAQADLTVAYDSLFLMPCPPANAIVADLGGTTVLPGVYCTASTIGVTGALTLDGNGDKNATFVFQGTAMTTAGDVVLINKAQAKNVYFVVSSSATLGTASHFQGNVVALSSVTLVDAATLVGRALARNGAVTLGSGNTITLP